jgi:phage terminase large subunit-like protein
MAVKTPKAPRRRKTASSEGSIPAKWRALMALLPGYDAIATAPAGYWFDVAAAENVIDFFHLCLKHVKGKLGGKPFYLEPHQQAKTGCIFGWKRPDGTRRYREVFDYEAKKNGKTPWSAGVMLYTMIRDTEPGMELYSAACDIEQAALVYQYAHGMILQEPELRSRIKVYTTRKTFEFLERFAYYRVLSKMPDTKHGLNVHMAIIDETHAHKDSQLIDNIHAGVAARTQPLIIHTTTADWLRPSVCNEKYEYACKVRDGVIHNPAFLPIIYEATPPEDEEVDPLWWTHERAWKQANPNLGISVERSFMEEACREAMEVPRKRNTFKRLHLNIRTGQDTVWFGIEAWDACHDRDFDLAVLQGKPCFAGLDLASTSDLCALVLYFPESHAVLPYFWLPQETVQKRYERNAVPYPLWVEEGHLRVTPGNVTDYDRIREDILSLAQHYHIVEIAIDRWNSTQLQTQLTGDGFEVVPFGQGFASMTAPSKELERLITARLLRHDGHPVMRWMASHCATEEDAAGNMKPAKNKSAEKIDGIVSLIMAIGRALVAEPAPGPSVYETRGALLL